MPSRHRFLGRWLACLAALLNLAAPVLAYAGGQALHERRGNLVHLLAPAPDASRADCHAGDHPQHRAAHCVYCLDFAAGAPLAPAPLVLADPPRSVAWVTLQHARDPAARASLRVASPRGPPHPA